MSTTRIRMLAVLALFIVSTEMLLCQWATTRVYIFQDAPATDGVESGYADTLTFGYDITATDCQDLTLGETELPPYPPAGVFDEPGKDTKSEVGRRGESGFSGVPVPSCRRQDKEEVAYTGVPKSEEPTEVSR